MYFVLEKYSNKYFFSQKGMLVANKTYKSWRACYHRQLLIKHRKVGVLVITGMGLGIKLNP